MFVVELQSVWSLVAVIVSIFITFVSAAWIVRKAISDAQVNMNKDMTKAIADAQSNTDKAISDVRVEMTKSFGEVRCDIKVVNTRMDGLDDRMDRLDNRMDRLDDRLGGLEGEVHGINQFLRRESVKSIESGRDS